MVRAASLAIAPLPMAQGLIWSRVKVILITVKDVSGKGE